MVSQVVLKSLVFTMVLGCFCIVLVFFACSDDDDDNDSGGSPTPTATSGPSPTSTPSVVGGRIVYNLPEGHLYQIAAEENASPEDLSVRLDSLAPGTDDWVNISPDGQWFLVSTDRFDPDCQGWPCLALVKQDLTQSHVLRTSSGVLHGNGYAAISSGGNMVIHVENDGPHHLDLWVLTKNGATWNEPELLTTASPYLWNHQPSLSADGAKVCFSCGNEPYAAAGTAICEVKTDGTDFRVVLTPDQGPGGTADNALFHPDYAPDGTIVFEADWSGEQIWRLPVGSTEPILLSGEMSNDNSPCVLPDGRVVSLWLDRPGGPGYHEIKVMDPDGSNSFMVLINVDIADASHGCGQ